MSRLQFARDKVDRVFGQCYAAAHPEVVASVMLSASLDWCAMHLAVAVRDVAAARENQAAIARGQLGGTERARRLSKAHRSEIARLGAITHHGLSRCR